MMSSLVSVHEAWTKLAERVDKLDSELVDITHAHSRVLAEPILADRPLPPFDRVMMDGIAIRLADYSAGQRSFVIDGLHAAGDPAVMLIGEALEVMTGAMLPSGADCVIPYELVDLAGGVAQLDDGMPLQPMQNIHLAASDSPAGVSIVKSGQLIGSAEIGVAASCGASQLACYKIPSLAVVTTGDELVDVSEKPLAHQIRRSNGLAVKSALEAEKLAAVDCLHLADDAEVLAEFVNSSDHEMLVFCGGVSKGKKDYVHQVLSELAGEPIFHGVAQRPGKPMGLWQLADGRLVVALPGNPVAVLAAIHVYLKPALNLMRGVVVNAQMVRLSEEFSGHAAFIFHVPVAVLGNAGVVKVLRAKNSADYAAAVGADGFVSIPAGGAGFNQSVPWFR
ncbi:molybdopterin molybdotransferase MoeA [Persicirhabdus sediminis]|uniref:Molybdopterin molybdenumtransferase n=1 Tax=Persicirhabdus sediminis TaxID=454144 RepID=A0A8J7SH88_9BACT|nr:molybdopterin molybdotransferase MoeA [Persicirhabdus sediminis]MBK1789674.1 molybdopterin molybdotransferase MoeA [Persicirhabdus sediminis]